MLHSFEDLAEIVGIEKGASARVAGQRDQGFLSGEVGVQGVDRGLPGIGEVPRRLAFCASPPATSACRPRMSMV